MKPNNKSLFELVNEKSNQTINQRLRRPLRRQPPLGVRVSCDPVNFWMEQQRRAASKK